MNPPFISAGVALGIPARFATNAEGRCLRGWASLICSPILSIKKTDPLSPRDPPPLFFLRQFHLEGAFLPGAFHGQNHLTGVRHFGHSDGQRIWILRIGQAIDGDDQVMGL